MRPSMSQANARRRRRKGAHSAGSPAIEVTVRYPFHPLAGRSFLILGQHEHYGAPHVLVRGTDGTTHLLPAWMTTPEAGGRSLWFSTASGLTARRSIGARRSRPDRIS
jgi:hypothetical protein